MRPLLAIASLSLAVLMTPTAVAALVIDVGSPNLRPNEANQKIAIRISGDAGDGLVQSLYFAFEILGISGQTIPIITGLDIVGSETIFNGTTTQFGTVYGQASDESQAARANTSTGSNVGVSPNGVLGFVTFNTTGIFSGSYNIKLINTAYDHTLLNGSSAFTVQNSTLTVAVAAVPEPSSVVFCGLLAGGWAFRRAAKRRHSAKSSASA